jgi:hypothetical protein
MHWQWFEAGEQVFGGAREGRLYPALNDIEAQRFWLGGFGAAWASQTPCDPDDPQALDLALLAALRGRESLLRQLRAHRTGAASQTFQ